MIKPGNDRYKENDILSSTTENGIVLRHVYYMVNTGFIVLYVTVCTSNK